MSNALHAEIAGINFDNIFLNASGVHCQTTAELDELLATQSTGAVITKSATSAYRAGNPSPRLSKIPLGSINSMGLPNEGLDYYLDYVTTKQADKPILLSVAGVSYTENLDILHKVQDSTFAGITELNLSCPNVPGKPQTAYDFETTERLLTEVFAFFTKPLGVKMPPYFDIVHFDDMAKILNKFPLVHVNTINSIGNGLWIDDATDTVVIKPKGGFGGIGGALAKPTALANVRAFRQRLNPSIKMIGTGGVVNGRDVYEHILCGADLVSVGTQLQFEGPSMFARLETELLAIMAEKGYASVDDFRGQLKVIE